MKNSPAINFRTGSMALFGTVIFVMAFSGISLQGQVLPTLYVSSTDNGHTTETSARGIGIDDFLQHTPAAAVFGLNASGVKGKHNFPDRVIILGTSTAIMVPSVYFLKKATRIERPDGSGNDAFPSGHSSFAFMGAEFMRKEFEETSLLPGILAYSLAAATGFIRLYEEKHRPVDIITGAFAGIFSMRLAYHLQPSIASRIPFGGEKPYRQISVLPWYENSGLGLWVSVVF